MLPYSGDTDAHADSACLTLQHEFAESLRLIPRDKLVVGLENHEDALHVADLRLRFDALRAANVTAIGIWATGIEDAWWPFLDAFAGKRQA